MIRPAIRSASLALLLVSCGGSDAPTTPEEPAVLQASPSTLALSEAQPTGTLFLTTKPAGRSLAWSVGSKSPWLTLSGESGTVKGTTILTATLVVPAAQEPGSMSGHIEFVFPTGNVTVPVTATVLPSPHLAIAPASLAIAAGSDTGEVTLTNTGHGGVSWRASSQVSWLSFPVTTGFVGTAQSVIVKVVVDRASLPAGGGTSSASIGILSGTDVSPVQIPVTVSTPP